MVAVKLEKEGGVENKGKLTKEEVDTSRQGWKQEDDVVDTDQQSAAKTCLIGKQLGVPHFTCLLSSAYHVHCFPFL